MSEEYETYLREQLALLRQSYEDAAKPLINELVKLAAMRPPSPIIIDLLSLPPEQRKFIEENLK